MYQHKKGIQCIIILTISISLTGTFFEVFPNLLINFQHGIYYLPGTLDFLSPSEGGVLLFTEETPAFQVAFSVLSRPGSLILGTNEFPFENYVFFKLRKYDPNTGKYVEIPHEMKLHPEIARSPNPLQQIDRETYIESIWFLMTPLEEGDYKIGARFDNRSIGEKDSRIWQGKESSNPEHFTVRKPRNQREMAMFYHHQGMNLKRDGNDAEAKKMFEKSLQTDPTIKSIREYGY